MTFLTIRLNYKLQKSKTLWKKIVRQDCLRRRNQIDLPEFYPGSIVAVTYADKYAANKTLSLVSTINYGP